MSVIVLPDEAKFWAGNLLSAKNSVNGGMAMSLFNVDLTLDSATTLADLQAAIATFPGYSDLSLANPSDPVFSGSRAKVTWDQLIWTRAVGAGIETIYGAFVYRVMASIQRLGWAFLFDTPITLAIPLQTIIITPVFSDGDIL